MDARQTYHPAAPCLERVAAIAGRSRLDGVRAAVIGAGRSGRAAQRLLEQKGADVTVFDDRGEHASIAESALAERDLIILSPGVPRLHPELASSIAQGALVGEVELASWFVEAPMVGITGTNGKSTTTALVAHILQQAGRRAAAGGNLGRPLSELALDADLEVLVVELSSYQLESIVRARFEVSCWLNLTSDHTDRYVDDIEYANAKARLLDARTDTGVAVLNREDPVVRARGEGLERVLWFGTDIEGFRFDNPAMPGVHNRSNMCAAIEIVRHLGLADDVIQAGLDSFRGLPHRLELVRELAGVHYYNDSKATNVESLATAMRAIEGPKVLIAGGRDKGAPWDPVVELARRNTRAVLCVGEAAAIVERAFSGAVPVVECTQTVERAVERAREIAEAGDAVLLSPACASFDQFESFEERGEKFRASVTALVEESK